MPCTRPGGGGVGGGAETGGVGVTNVGVGATGWRFSPHADTTSIDINKPLTRDDMITYCIGAASFSKMGRRSLCSSGQVFGQHSHVANHGHEAGVAIPSRHE